MLNNSRLVNSQTRGILTSAICVGISSVKWAPVVYNKAFDYRVDFSRNFHPSELRRNSVYYKEAATGTGFGFVD